MRTDTTTEITTTPPTPHVLDELPVEDRSSDLRRLARVNRWLALVLVVVVVAIAATAILLDGSAGTTRSDAASTARWNEAAAQYEAIRTARANAAWAARMDAAATHYEAIRRAAALDADAARLTRQAEVRHAGD